MPLGDPGMAETPTSNEPLRDVQDARAALWQCCGRADWLLRVLAEGAQEGRVSGDVGLALRRFACWAAVEAGADAEDAMLVYATALAGGRTPFPAYRRLATMPLDWSRVVLLPTDERCVPHDHAACNVRELREAFGEASGVRIESLTVDDGDPVRSEAHARELLAS